MQMQVLTCALASCFRSFSLMLAALSQLLHSQEEPHTQHSPEMFPLMAVSQAASSLSLSIQHKPTVSLPMASR